MIRPLPRRIGVGFTSDEPLPLSDAYPQAEGYRYEVMGRYHNYFVTPDRWEWPENKFVPGAVRIDGFSPNLNKSLHVGHLRNLALANSLRHILVRSEFVALLGASLGVTKAALTSWQKWTGMLRYEPKVYYDVTLPNDVVETRYLQPGVGDDTARYWDGPNGPVVVVRSDGRPLYAFHDLTFAKEVKPDYYITGHEQKEHFTSLGLGEKHLAMGLVLGTDGKKMKSRDGTAFLADEAMDVVKEMIGDVDDPEELSWNILCWNFLHAARATNVMFQPDKWIKPESPGMYITYTYARVRSALGANPQRFWFDPQKAAEWVEEARMNQSDVELMGVAEQYRFYYNQSVEKYDPASLANYTFELAKEIGSAYGREKIAGGRRGFNLAISHATFRLGECMEFLGMFKLSKV